MSIIKPTIERDLPRIGLPDLPDKEELVSRLPNLFIIGASKSGSSALHAYLNAHPDIRMSDEKEPCFFVKQEELKATWPIMARNACSHDWEAYLSLWTDGEEAKYRGESSVYYSQTPHRSGIPERIAAVAPSARIIYTIREPVSRAIGHYWQRQKEFQEPLSLDRAIRENALYRDTSDYALQIKAYLEFFDQSQIFVISAENLRVNRRETLSEILNWLGLPSYQFTDSEITERHKSPTTTRRQRFPLVKTLRDTAVWAKLREGLPERAMGMLRSAATIEFEKKEVDESSARSYLNEYLKPRVKELEALLGRSFDEWEKC
ncbi:sulfotransferase family protein [Roseibium sp.]|uniref:sulfotransferase family protein n=1 Tax=Roseibium sp. TaxID=1936156 RepID=UPI003B50FC40